MNNFMTLEYSLVVDEQKRGISGISKKESSTDKEVKITDRKGNEVLKLSSNCIKKSCCEVLEFSGSFKTKTFKAYFELNKQVRLSELGKNGVLGEIVFTPKGKQIREPLNSVAFVFKQLEPITDMDTNIAATRMLEAIREMTPHIPARIPWVKGESLFDNIPLESRSHLQKLRSSIQKLVL